MHIIIMYMFVTCYSGEVVGEPVEIRDETF